MLACGRLITPTVTSRCVASEAVRMRKAADLPQPGTPVTRAKPPSPASCCTLQQNDSRRVVTCSASVGTLGVNGFHLRPYSASIRAVRQGGLMKDAEPGETFGDLGCGHRASVVAHGGAWQPALLHRLRQTVGDVLSTLGQVPL